MSRNLDTHENALIFASRLIYIAAQVYLVGVLEPAVQMHFFGGSVDKPGFSAAPCDTVMYGTGGLNPVCRLIIGVFKAKCTVVGVAYSLRA